MKLDLVSEEEVKGNQKVYQCMSGLNYEIILPVHANIKPWEIQINFKNGWSKINSEERYKSKHKKAPGKKAGKEIKFEATKDTVEDIFG